MSNRSSQKWDAKRMTMHKTVHYGNVYDDNDQLQEFEVRNVRLPHRSVHARGQGHGAPVRNYLEKRRERQLYRSVGGSSTATAVIMNLVKVPRGAAIGKDFILRSIGLYVDDLKPLLLKEERRDVSFFIEDDETAAAIRAISRRVRDPRTNEPITFLVTRASAGYATITPNERNLIQEALKKRYIADNHALDLSEFGLDNLFRSRDLHLSLNRNNIMMSVVELIDQHYGDVTALSIKGNRLRFLDFFACLLYRIRNVKTLDLSSNQIDKVSELEKLKGWPIETLYFEGNPLCALFPSAEEYLRAIHQIFPKVTMLDGIPVQRSVMSALPESDDSARLPPNKPSFYGSDERRSLIEAFVMEYISVYDDPDISNRKNLIKAYDDNATFTLSIENLPDVGEKRPYSNDSGTYSFYRKTSHNICHIERWERYREKLVHRGAMDIVVELSKLPPTQHLMETFIIDVSLITEKHMCFAVQGFFRDGLNKVEPGDEYKYFCRNFVVITKGDGKIAVVSDILFISSVFAERVQRYKSMLTNLIKVANADAVAIATSTIDTAVNGMTIEDTPSNLAQRDKQRTPAEIAASGDEDMQKQMVEAFCNASKMKPEWSRKCLIDQNWDYEKAGEAFMAVRNQIPPEAFQ